MNEEIIKKVLLVTGILCISFTTGDSIMRLTCDVKDYMKKRKNSKNTDDLIKRMEKIVEIMEQKENEI